MAANILFVDDEPLILEGIAAVLRKEKYNVLKAGSGREALEILKRHVVDIIVTDESMPEMLGHELLCRVSRMYPSTIRILLTGNTSKNTLIHVINEVGIYRFLSKPCPAEALIGALNDALYHKAYNEDKEKAAILKLEHEEPGITSVDYTEDGSILLADNDIDLMKLEESLSKRLYVDK